MNDSSLNRLSTQRPESQVHQSLTIRLSTRSQVRPPRRPSSSNRLSSTESQVRQSLTIRLTTRSQVRPSLTVTQSFSPVLLWTGA